jgi:hypothetical protein
VTQPDHSRKFVTKVPSELATVRVEIIADKTSATYRKPVAIPTGGRAGVTGHRFGSSPPTRPEPPCPCYWASSKSQQRGGASQVLVGRDPHNPAVLQCGERGLGRCS